MITSTSFRANAHLLKLLGDELIGDDRLAVFELVKNAYDSDAKRVDVQLNLNVDMPNIVVWDYSGCGMTYDDIVNKWMVIGTKSKRYENRVRTKRFNRMPLGEKGVGRLAVHKLGEKLVINTRAENSDEYRVVIDWAEVLNNSNFIEDTVVKVEKLEKPEFFSEDTGTRIEISRLNNKTWTRGELRKLKRLITSLVSPFKEVSDFEVNYIVPGREKELYDVLDANDILSKAIWKYSFEIDEDGRFSYKYNFSPPSSFKTLIDVEKSGDDGLLKLLQPTKEEKAARGDNSERLTLSKSELDGIGPISGTFYVFLKSTSVLNAFGAAQSIKDYLKEQSGIRIYRDGIRVFNYGETNDDWLELNAGRINLPGLKIDTGMVVGSIDLNLSKSTGLKEKTNREGFDDNKFYRLFKLISTSVVEHFHITHRNDRESISKYLNNDAIDISPATYRFSENIASLKNVAKKHNLGDRVVHKISQIENDYIQMREVTLSSGVAGLNLAVIFHEVERGVDDLNDSIKRSDDYATLLKRAEHLSELLEGFAPLLRRNEQRTFKAKSLISKTLGLAKHRFEYHNIILSSPILNDESSDFDIHAPFGLLQATLTNLVDNAIHWTKLKREELEEDYQPAIYVDSLIDWFKEGPAIVIGDNGPGFSISPEEAVQPFKTTRPGGMGVGLYYADKVMESIGGSLILLSPDDVELPEAYGGAIAVMLFKNGDMK
ncbi:ATP-binding protein [Shewanella sp. GXUN23E]|uniref:ATP-binding protein n=1 Tax=Shewanella sp. GXUN23E TaxID=3422498 RepID=UPI003D7E5AEF